MSPELPIESILTTRIGTISIWTFSRFWWQRGGKKVLESKRDVRLPEIINLANPGEGLDVLTVLRWKVFSKKHLSVLAQLLLVFLVTTVCTLAGPLAKISLRIHQTLELRDVQVSKAWKSAAEFSSSVYDNVNWNNTMTSLNEAGFPYDQLLDYSPPSNIPWKYQPEEWDPTWRAACDFDEETVLENLEATGNATLLDVMGIFPAYERTFDTK
jgi:hypothetical protein